MRQQYQDEYYLRTLQYYITNRVQGGYRYTNERKSLDGM